MVAREVGRKGWSLKGLTLGTELSITHLHGITKINTATYTLSYWSTITLTFCMEYLLSSVQLVHLHLTDRLITNSVQLLMP